MRRLLKFTLMAGLVIGPARAAEVANGTYRLTLQPDHGIEVQVAGLPPQRLAPRFVVMYSDRNPGFGQNRVGRFDHASPRPFPKYPVLAQRWSFYADDPAAPRREIDRLGAADDFTLSVNSLGERFLHYHDRSGNAASKQEDLALRGTANPFLAGDKNVLLADSAMAVGHQIRWTFPAQANFSLAATVTLPPGKDPEIRYELTVRRPGFYSVAFTGAPSIRVADLLPVPQETQDREHGVWNYLMSEAHVSLPRVQLATAAFNSALVVDPAESPFRLVQDSRGVWTYALAAESNSRFGLMTAGDTTQVRPVVFAPIMGGPESQMPAGEVRHFTVRYVLRGGPWEATYRYIAKEIYDFRDRRDNSGTGPLYHTLENLLDYLSDRDVGNYSMWHAEQKYYNYWSDQSGIFKPFSPLFCLSAAIVTDDERFYRTRALPMVEFALSRQTNVFAPYAVKASGMVTTLASPLGGSYLDAGQLHALAGMYQNRSYAISPAAATAPGKNRGMEALAVYRATGNRAALAEAERAADLKSGNFMDLLELYEATGRPRYLEAAHAAAYRYVSGLNLFPAVPDRNVRADADGAAPIHGHAYQRHEDWGFPRPQPLPIPAQTVPAWRVSLIGTQLDVYRGGYWLNHHAQLMRLATYTHDDFLRDLQRWAMVGRFGNFAGDFRSIRHSLIGERADAPLHYIYATDYSTFNPGHASEWVGAVIDFIVSDLFNRSNAAIDFPSRCMYDSGFRVKVYGDRPGRFYDEKDAHLWLPRHLLTSSNPQVDYLAAYGNGKLYLAFWNQSFQTEPVSVRLNPSLVAAAGIHHARQWNDNVEGGPADVVDNALHFVVPPKGIVAYAIPDVRVTTGLQAKLFAPDAPTLGADSFVHADAGFGRLTAMLLSLGKGLTTSYVYTDAPASTVITAELKYRQGDGPWQRCTDAIYPFEFSTRIDESGGPFECVMEVQTTDGRRQQSAPVILRWKGKP